MRAISSAAGSLLALVRLVLFLLGALFGRISWTPPGWLLALTASLASTARRLAARPGLAIGLAAGIALLGVAAYEGAISRA